VAELASDVGFDVWVIDDRQEYCNSERFPSAKRLIVDAIDVAFCEITSEGDRHSVSLLSFHSLPFSDDLRGMILKSMAGEASMENLSDLPFALAQEYAQAFRQASASTNVELVSMHGQTLWHHPPVSTWQAGCGSALSALLNLPVVHNFRSADVALGGQGAPLVPIFDHATLTSQVPRIALNIGGMANISILPANASEEDVWACDTGPGNVWIDVASRVTFGKRYDTNGEFARAGRLIPPLLQECKTIPFFSMGLPKSTGRELFSEKEARRLITKYSHPSSPLEDVVTTLTELTAWSIVDHITRLAPASREMIVSGGGSQNSFLLERIEGLVQDASLDLEVQIHPQWDSKEAMAFAYLGWRTIHGLSGNLPRVTGASRPAILGSISRA